MEPRAASTVAAALHTLCNTTVTANADDTASQQTVPGAFEAAAAAAQQAAPFLPFLLLTGPRVMSHCLCSLALQSTSLCAVATSILHVMRPAWTLRLPPSLLTPLEAGRRDTEPCALHHRSRFDEHRLDGTHLENAGSRGAVVVEAFAAELARSQGTSEATLASALPLLDAMLGRSARGQAAAAPLASVHDIISIVIEPLLLGPTHGSEAGTSTGVDDGQSSGVRTAVSEPRCTTIGTAQLAAALLQHVLGLEGFRRGDSTLVETALESSQLVEEVGGVRVLIHLATTIAQALAYQPSAFPLADRSGTCGLGTRISVDAERGPSRRTDVWPLQAASLRVKIGRASCRERVLLMV